MPYTLCRERGVISFVEICAEKWLNIIMCAIATDLSLIALNPGNSLKVCVHADMSFYCTLLKTSFQRGTVKSIEISKAVQILAQIEWTREQRMAQLLLIQTWWQTRGDFTPGLHRKHLHNQLCSMKCSLNCILLHCVGLWIVFHCGGKLLLGHFRRQSINFHLQSIRQSCGASKTST